MALQLIGLFRQELPGSPEMTVLCCLQMRFLPLPAEESLGQGFLPGEHV